MREHYRSPRAQGMAHDTRDTCTARVEEEAPSTTRAGQPVEEGQRSRNDEDAPTQSVVVKINSESGVDPRVKHYGIVAANADLQLASNALASLAATTAPDSSPVMQFQVSLRADQLARLWLRESNLTSDNVFVWSSKKGQWVPALSNPEVSREITRARVEQDANAQRPDRGAKVSGHPASKQIATDASQITRAGHRGRRFSRACAPVAAGEPAGTCA